MMPYARWTFACVLPSLLALGCGSKSSPADGTETESGGGETPSTGDDGGTQAGGEGPHASACIDVVTVLSPDEVSPLGFSAEAMLEGKLGTRQTELIFANEPTNLSQAIAGSVLPLEVTLAWEGGEVRWVDSELDPDYDAGGMFDVWEPDCQGRLEIDVAFHFVTAGGELDERVQTTLAARSLDRAELVGSSKTAQGTDLFPPALAGSLDPTMLFDDETTTVTGLVATATWYEAQAGGYLMVEVRGGDDQGDGGWIGFGNLAQWGDEIPWEHEE